METADAYDLGCGTDQLFLASTIRRQLGTGTILSRAARGARHFVPGCVSAHRATGRLLAHAPFPEPIVEEVFFEIRQIDRILIGSPSLGFDHFAAAQAGSTNADTLRAALHSRANWAQIHIPAALAYVVSVADVISKLRPFAAYITNVCHECSSQSLLLVESNFTASCHA